MPFPRAASLLSRFRPLDRPIRLQPILARVGRPTVVLGLAVSAGLTAAWSARQHIMGHVQRLEADARVPMVSRVVAAQDLPAGTRLSPELMAARDFPEGLVPSESIDIAFHTRLSGMVLRSRLRAGDLILPVHGQVADPTSFSSQLGDGRRAITMPVDAINSVSGLLQPGDLIDLYVSFEYQRRRITAPLLQGVLVLATGAQTQATGVHAHVNGLHPLGIGAGTPAQTHGFTTVTLDTSPEDAVKLVAARQGGTLTAVLRHPNDDRPSGKAARGDLASLIGVANPPPRAHPARAPVLYGNQNARRVPSLVPTSNPQRNPSGIFELPAVQQLVSAWLLQGGASDAHAAHVPAHPPLDVLAGTGPQVAAIAEAPSD